MKKKLKLGDMFYCKAEKDILTLIKLNGLYFNIKRKKSNKITNILFNSKYMFNLKKYIPINTKLARLVYLQEEL